MIAFVVVVLVIAVAAGWRRDAWTVTARRLLPKLLALATIVGIMALSASEALGYGEYLLLLAVTMFVSYGVGVALLSLIAYAAATLCAMASRRRPTGN